MKPEKTFRAGLVSATIWANEAEVDGKKKQFKTVNFERSYKNKDEEWQKTNSLNIADLPRAITVLQKAYEYLAVKEDAKEELVI